jgi:hypothetical protein
VAFRVLGEAGGEGFEEGVAFRGGEFGLGGHGEMMWLGLWGRQGEWEMEARGGFGVARGGTGHSVGGY